MRTEIIERSQSLKALAESSTEGAYYIVEQNEDGWTCTCLDHQTRFRDCKHIREVQERYT